MLGKFSSNFGKFSLTREVIKVEFLYFFHFCPEKLGSGKILMLKKTWAF
jgi:hypothetical protein